MTPINGNIPYSLISQPELNSSFKNKTATKINNHTDTSLTNHTDTSLTNRTVEDLSTASLKNNNLEKISQQIYGILFNNLQQDNDANNSDILLDLIKSVEQCIINGDKPYANEYKISEADIPLSCKNLYIDDTDYDAPICFVDLIFDKAELSLVNPKVGKLEEESCSNYKFTRAEGFKGRTIEINAKSDPGLCNVDTIFTLKLDNLSNANKEQSTFDDLFARNYLLYYAIIKRDKQVFDYLLNSEHFKTENIDSNMYKMQQITNNNILFRSKDINNGKTLLTQAFYKHPEYIDKLLSNGATVTSKNLDEVILRNKVDDLPMTERQKQQFHNFLLLLENLNERTVTVNPDKALDYFLGDEAEKPGLIDYVMDYLPEKERELHSNLISQKIDRSYLLECGIARIGRSK